MSRIIGLGLTLLKDKKIEDDSLNREFIFKSFSYKDNLEKDQTNLNSSINRPNLTNHHIETPGTPISNSSHSSTEDLNSLTKELINLIIIS